MRPAAWPLLRRRAARRGGARARTSRRLPDGHRRRLRRVPRGRRRRVPPAQPPDRGRTPDAPLDEMPPMWRSKQPDLLRARRDGDAVGARAVRDARARCGGPVRARVARDVPARARRCSAPDTRAAVLAMAITGLNAMVLETVLHPYFNQTLGLLRVPVLAPARLVGGARPRPRGGRAARALHARRRARLPARAADPGARAGRLLRARPARAPAPRRPDRRCRAAAGLWRGGRGLVWMVPLAVAARDPGRGERSTRRGTPRGSCSTRTSRSGAGPATCSHFIPAHEFFGLATDTLWWLAVAAMAGSGRSGS